MTQSGRLRLFYQSNEDNRSISAWIFSLITTTFRGQVMFDNKSIENANFFFIVIIKAYTSINRG
jgi:hypothetical protein